MSSRNSLGISPAVRAAVIARDLSTCQWCGRHVRTESGWYSIQHRRARGMGGSRSQATNQPANLLLVCGTGTTECHGWIEAHPAEALARGFRISSSARPALVPYTDSTGREWILNDDAGKSESFTGGKRGELVKKDKRETPEPPLDPRKLGGKWLRGEDLNLRPLG